MQMDNMRSEHLTEVTQKDKINDNNDNSQMILNKFEELNEHNLYLHQQMHNKIDLQTEDILELIQSQQQFLQKNKISLQPELI